MWQKDITWVAYGGQTILVSFWLLDAIILWIQISDTVFLRNPISLIGGYLTRRRAKIRSHFSTYE